VQCGVILVLRPMLMGIAKSDTRKYVELFGRF
jgi:hypothetical protein